MSVHSGSHQGETRTTAHDQEHWPEGHYRGRGNLQEGTGPNGPFLDGGPAEFMRAPDPGVAEAPPTRDPLKEAQLADRVREALSDHGDIDAGSVDVDVDGDHVVLRGTVRTHWAHHYAANLASSVDGIGSLENLLAIAEDGQNSDDDDDEPDTLRQV